jgi:hypothetical protein
MENVLNLDGLVLAKGGHASPTEGACVMEAVSMLAQEPFTDEPECVCPTIRAFLINWNDSLNDEDRQKLKPLIPLVVGTNQGEAMALRRSYMVADWYVRTYLPAWLRLAKLDAEADAVASLPECSDKGSLKASETAVFAARDKSEAAGAAAGAAARAAARAAAWDAARDAAGAAAGAAARAAAWAAARDAAGAAARDAAGAALRPTVVELQASAIALVERMCEASERPASTGTERKPARKRKEKS